MRKIPFILVIVTMLITFHAVAETTSYRPSESEGYTFAYQGSTAVVHRVQSGSNNLYGVFFLPDDFDINQQYPALIFSHGYNSSSYADTDYVPYLTQWGVVCYKFDFAGGSIRSRSRGDFLQMSLLTEKADLLVVIDDIASQPFVDPDRIALIGMSQGGAVTGLTAPDVSDRIRGEILVYPAFNILDDTRAQYASPDELPDEILLLSQYVGRRYFTDVWDLNLAAESAQYTGPVLLIHGTGDQIVDYQCSVSAASLFADARLVTLDGAPHGFGKKEIAELSPTLKNYLQEIGMIPQQP